MKQTTAIKIIGSYPFNKNVDVLSNIKIEDGNFLFTNFQSKITFPVIGLNDTTGLFESAKIKKLFSKFPSFKGQNNNLIFIDKKTSIAMEGKEIASYPELDNLEYEKLFTCNGIEFLEKIKDLQPTMSTSDSRRYLNCIYLEGKESSNIIGVSTDGRCLGIREFSIKATRDFSLMLPSEDINFLIKVIPVLLKDDPSLSINLLITDREYKIEIGDFTLEGVFVDGTFPNYQQVIPAKKEASFSIPMKDLETFVKKMKGMPFNKNYYANLNMVIEKGSLNINTYEKKFTEEWGKVKTSITVMSMNNPSEAIIETGLNTEYLSNILQGFSKEEVLTFDYNTPLAAIKVYGKDVNNFSLIMPCKRED